MQRLKSFAAIVVSESEDGGAEFAPGSTTPNKDGYEAKFTAEPQPYTAGKGKEVSRLINFWRSRFVVQCVYNSKWKPNLMVLFVLLLDLLLWALYFHQSHQVRLKAPPRMGRDARCSGGIGPRHGPSIALVPCTAAHIHRIHAFNTGQPATLHGPPGRRQHWHTRARIPLLPARRPQRLPRHSPA